MNRFAGIAAALERGAQEHITGEINKFKLNLCVGIWQMFVEIFLSFMPKSRRKKAALREKTEKFLSVIRTYRPLIEEQYKLYHHFFYAWEYDNCESGYHRQAEDSRGEKNALAEIRRLTDELQAELDMAGWEYNPIPHKCTLVMGYPGQIYIDNALQYFEMLERHFESKARKLS
jgi:hypothetical protein